MQHAQNRASIESTMNPIVYLIDQGSGWEQEEEVVWVIDEGNEAEWENQLPYILD